ncbi:MAG: hypothetical protein AAFP03_07650 [Cyanobacteria bacterium J06598_3]
MHLKLKLTLLSLMQQKALTLAPLTLAPLPKKTLAPLTLVPLTLALLTLAPLSNLYGVIFRLSSLNGDVHTKM